MRSLKKALLAYILVGVTLALLAAGAAVFMAARSNLRAQFDQSLLNRARMLGGLVVEEDGLLEFEFSQPLDEAHAGALVRMSADDGRVLAQSPDWPADFPVVAVAPHDQPELADAMLDGRNARLASLAMFVATDSSAAPLPGRSAAAPHDSDAAPSNETGPGRRFVVVQVMAATDGVRRALAAVAAALIVGGSLALIGSAIAVWFGIRRGLAPVTHLGRMVDDIRPESLVLPAQPADYPQELQPIVSAIEGLLGRLRGALERERRFTDAAAHELRTPISELKTITDVADRWPEPQRLHRAIKDARPVIREIEDLLESLLAAARGAAADGDLRAQDVPLIPLAREAAQQAMDRLGRSGVAWSFEGDEGLSWSGPRGVIAAIVRNLIENAAEYTPDAGSVSVTASTGDVAKCTVVFEVENGPVLLEAHAVQRVFEPFWRADAARSDRRHRGLGLPIVQSLARGMGLELDAALTPQRRLKIRLVQRGAGLQQQGGTAGRNADAVAVAAGPQKQIRAVS